MNPAYEHFQKEAEKNKQLFTLLRFACRCNHLTALTFNTSEAVPAFLSAKAAKIRIRSLAALDAKETSNYLEMAQQLKLDLEFLPIVDVIEPTELLYINTPAEGNYRAQELTKYAAQVSKYICLPNTVSNGLTASPMIKVPDNMQPIGLNFGINHFLQTYDDWFILEHDDIEPGMTILVNRKNVTNAFS